MQILQLFPNIVSLGDVSVKKISIPNFHGIFSFPCTIFPIKKKKKLKITIAAN